MPSSSSAPPRAKRRFRNISVFDIVRYWLPMPGIVSILHRLSGFFLFLLLPIALFLFDRSLNYPDFFHYTILQSHHWSVRVVLCIAFWSFIHHLLSGLRFLFLDFHWGVDKKTARFSSISVFTLAVFLTLIFLAWLIL